jgi:hypothetical protein
MHLRVPLRALLLGLLLSAAPFWQPATDLGASAAVELPAVPDPSPPPRHRHRHHHPHHIALRRIFNNPGPRATKSLAFWTIGYPFKDGELPRGKVISGCELGRKVVPCSLIARKLAADGSVEWGQLLVDFSGAPIPARGSEELTLDVASGSWDSATTITDADWEALGDRVVLSNLTTSGVTGADTNGTGTWVAKFNGGRTNTIETYGSSPQGLFVEVTAEFVGAGVVNRNLTAVMDYWVTEDASGSEGPIESWGPFIRNTLLHPSDPSISTLAAYSYDATFQRGGETIRSYQGLTTPALAIGVMTRPDAQGDWTADDPGIYVTQNYTDVVATGKLPPFAPGVTYTGATFPQPFANVTNISGAIITVDHLTNVFGNINGDTLGYQPSAVQFGGAPLPGGINRSTVYWAVHEGSNMLSIYDTLNDALANGTTGLITPTSPGTSVTVSIVEAPGATGQYNLVLGDPGSRPDISMLGEWFSGGYLVGDTEAWQQLARVMAYDQAGNPLFGIDGATGRIMSLMDSPNTPHGMTSYPNDYYGNAEFSPDINKGATPSGGTGGWQYAGSGVAHMPNTVFGVWLMEGGPFLRDLLVGTGESALSLSAFLPQRNFALNGTTYYGSMSCVYNGTNTRVGAWHMRDVIEAAMAAPQGSPEETYFRNVLTENMNECTAYENYKPATYRALGLIVHDEDGFPPQGTTIGVQEVEGFMQSYLAAVFAWGTLLEGDYVPGLGTQAAFMSQWFNFAYGVGSTFCPYYATAYVLGPGLSGFGVPVPGQYASSLYDLGLEAGGGTFSFTSGGAVVTDSADFPWSLAAGDLFRPTNYDTTGNQAVETTTPPSPFGVGTDYFIEPPVPAAKTFQLSTTLGGTAISASASTSGVDGFFVPAGQTTCPPSGTFVGSTTNPDDYLPYQMTALSLMAEIGITGADTAYSAAASRFTGSCSTAMRWCMAPP